MAKNFFEDLGETEELIVLEGGTPDLKSVLGQMATLQIGIARLRTDETLALQVRASSKRIEIVRFDQRIADVPGLEVLRTREALVAHLKETAGLDVTRIES